MAKVKNVTGEDRLVPGLGDRLVVAGQEVEVPDGDMYAYTQQAGWRPVGDDAQRIHDDAAARDELVAQVLESDEQPAGNATRDEWAAYAATKNVDADGMSRDEIRDHFKKELV